IAGHVKPISHITLNCKDNVFVTLSKDNNVRVWCENVLPLQSFQVQGMENGSITSMCYNTYNNELVLANTKIGSYLGRGTDVFQNAITSHDKPLCCALYNILYKQVVSVCQDGVVTVWEVSTGQVASKFKVTPDKHVGHTTIAFDETQRKLITVSQDRKLKFWNFNSGSLLSVLPVTLPKKVTGIVCSKNRVYVSGRNIIYDLDIEGFDYSCFSHHYLKDISSMGVHEGTLITASSNGNIVIWDTDQGKALCWMNDSKSPRTFRVDRRLTGSRPDENNPEKSQTENKKDNLVVCLKKRKVKNDTATLLTSSDGYICAWSVSINGGLIGKFRAVDKEGAVINTMSTDLEEQILMTWDSTGKFCQWDIASFGFRKQAKEEPFEDRNGWHVSLAQPPLLGSWQCHLTEVVSVQCDHSCTKVITAGLDRYLHLWHNTGSHIGVFGKDKWIDSDLSFEKNADQEEAAGSATTLTKNDEKPI
ncbi:WD repeat-containing protein on Y chromosome-like, partial [Anarrhichthys ocellatus]|uniref:WD repeat-containing protein on Y chromosome-like n=1 Tax=Anarrhichthys ocellatus TaxID=433405 RepID=UPI0012ECE602